jgi:hypothetical protein
MTLDMNHLYGTWETLDNDGQKITLTLDADGEFKLRYEKDSRAMKLMLDADGTWIVKDGNILVLRIKLSKHKAARALGISTLAKIKEWIEEELLATPHGKGYWDRSHEIVKLKKNKLQLDDDEYERVRWPG